MKICREFTFDAAHPLENYKGKCEQLHGHTYKLEVVVEGEVKKNGMVMDFAQLKKIVEKQIIEKLDHSNLNNHTPNPTAEKIAEWIYTRLKKDIPLRSIKLWEGEGKWVKIERK